MRIKSELKNKNWDNVYLVLAGLLAFSAVCCIILAICHPRVQNIALVFYTVWLTDVCFRWADTDRYDRAGTRKKVVKEWKKRKKAAKKAGEDFTEEFPRQIKKEAGHIPRFLMDIMFVGFYGYLFFSMIGVGFSDHRIYEYRSDIAQLKENGSRDYSYFPDRIPKGAEDVHWRMKPAFLQGSGYELLYFKATPEIIAQFEAKISQLDFIEPTEDAQSFGSKYDTERAAQLTYYILSDNGDWNHHHMSGMFYDEERGYIGFFCE